MKTLTQTSATDGQLKQIKRVATDAAEKAIADFGLDKDGAQRVHAHGDELAEAIHTAVTASLKDLSVSDKFKNEEVDSKYGYLSGYKPKGLNEQCNQLRILFQGIGFPNQDLLAQIEKGEVELPKNAEGWFAIPNWMKNPKIFGATYSEALLKVIDTIKQTRSGKFYNYREGQLDEKRLRQSARTQKFWKELSQAQGDPDILIVPAQFGIRHRGRSVRRAREVFLTNEFGLGAFAVGTMVLTHPERLQHYDDLWVDCAGDEFDDSGSDVRFDRAPFFKFFDGEVEFDAGCVGHAFGLYGAASGLVPQ
jgi:hypothetical protein